MKRNGRTDDVFISDKRIQSIPFYFFFWKFLFCCFVHELICDAHSNVDVLLAPSFIFL
jgi:hypothetical protein